MSKSTKNLAGDASSDVVAEEVRSSVPTMPFETAVAELVSVHPSALSESAYVTLAKNATRLTPVQSVLFGQCEDLRAAGSWAKLVEDTATTEDTRPCSGIKIKGITYSYRELEKAGITDRMIREDIAEVEKRLASTISRIGGTGKASRRTTFRTRGQVNNEDQSISHSLSGLQNTQRRIAVEKDLAVLGLESDALNFAQGYCEAHQG